MSTKAAKQPTRLKKRRDFLAARNGARSHERAFVLQLAKNDGHNLRIGFTVTKKVGNAVERNRIKRRLREVVTACFSDNLDIDHFGHADCVLIARQEVLYLGFDDLKSAFTKAITHAHKRLSKRTVANCPPFGQKRPQKTNGSGQSDPVS